MAGYQQVVGTVPVRNGPVNKWFQAFLTDDGLVSGDENAIGAYATTTGAATHFWYAATENTRIERMMVEIVDEQGMAAADYGNVTGSLAVGVMVQHFASDGTTKLHDFTLQAAIKTNAEWARYCYDVDIKTWGAGSDFLYARWTFMRAGTAIRLETGDHFAVVLHDDFDAMIGHRFLIQGYREGTFSHDS